jgi:hypothetical protein
MLRLIVFVGAFGAVYTISLFVDRVLRLNMGISCGNFTFVVVLTP